MPHTPGPWVYAYEGSGSHNVYDLAADDLIASCCGDKGFDESTANALLIAQAPAMYELLKESEWIGTGAIEDCGDGFVRFREECPYCYSSRQDGHKSTCRLAAVLKSVEGKS